MSYETLTSSVAFTMGTRALRGREASRILDSARHYYSKGGSASFKSSTQASNCLMSLRPSSSRPPVYGRYELRPTHRCPTALLSNMSNCSDVLNTEQETFHAQRIGHEAKSNLSTNSTSSPQNKTVWPEKLTGKTAVKVSEALRLVATWLGHHNVVDPEPSAAELLAKAWGFRSPREMLAERPRLTKAALSSAEWDVLRQLCLKRAEQHAPVQYLVGEWDFHGVTLEMKAPTLIPRPETEELVETILKWLRSEVKVIEGGRPTVGHEQDLDQSRGMRFLDVGSGTGALGLALLKELPGATCVAIDSQEAAVRLSRRNAQRIGLQNRYTCLHTSIEAFGVGREFGVRKAGAFQNEEDVRGSFDFIVSNPPYIPTGDMARLPPDVADHEDHVALDGGEDGLDVVRRIVQKCPELLRRGGFRQLWMEVDTSHPERIGSWLEFNGCKEDERCTRTRRVNSSGEATHGVTMFEWRRDLSRRPRFVCLKFAEVGSGTDA